MKQTPKKRNWILISLVAVFIILAIYAFIKGNAKPKGTPVSVAVAEKRTIKETVSASGKIYPVTEVKISSDVSGEIVELYVKEGDSVVMGQILAKINPDAYVSAVERGEASLNTSKAQLAISKAQIESNKAQMEQILAQLENAKTIHKRNEQLKKDGVISQAELDQSFASMRQLEANLRSAEASIKSAQQNALGSEFSIKGANASLSELKTNLSRTTIKSPTNGIVSKLSVEKGERVVGTIQMTGTEMMRISNLNSMEVQVNVSENDILKVSVGDEVDVDVDSYLGKKFKGKVTQVANSASNVSSTATTINTDQVTNFTVKIGIEEASYADVKSSGLKYPLRPGMSASVDIYTEQAVDVISLPIQCVTIREKQSSIDKRKQTTKKEGEVVMEAEVKDKEFDEVVFGILGDTSTMIVVKTGIQDNEFIEIKSGVKVSDKIISGPYTEVSKKLKSGQKVRIKEDKDEADQKKDD